MASSSSASNKVGLGIKPPEPLYTALRECFHSQRFTDATVACRQIQRDNGAAVKTKRTFKVHRGIVAARSAVFNAMLTKDFDEAKNGDMEIDDEFGDDVVAPMLEYIYCGYCEVERQVVAGLFVASNHYELIDLMKACEGQLFAQMSVETVVNVGLIADRHRAPKLRQATVDFIAKNYEAVSGREDTFSKLAGNLKLLKDVFDATAKKNSDPAETKNLAASPIVDQESWSW